MRTKSEFKNKRVTIIGLATTGIAVAKLLYTLGAKVFGSDSRTWEQLPEESRELNKFITMETGMHTDRVITDTDLIVVSPGVSSEIPILKEALARNIPILSEIEIAASLIDVPIIAVTGTNGKSTTVTLLGEILKHKYPKTVVAGNIGLPLSSIVFNLDTDSVVVAEISSFQLEHIINFKPYVSVILNITPDHLDRHKNFDAYLNAKKRIFENQTGLDFTVLNADDTHLTEFTKCTNAQVILFSISRKLDKGVWVENGIVKSSIFGCNQTICETKNIGIKGPHNLANALSAICVALVFNVEPDRIKHTLYTFSGLEHRLELVDEINGIKFVNDSKATNIHAVRCALHSFDEPIVLIAGGYDKSADFYELRDVISEKVKSLVLIGDAALKLKQSWGDLVPTYYSDSLEEAVKISYKLANSGDCVLLSPACASYDMFDNFEHRGRVFKQAVRELST